MFQIKHGLMSEVFDRIFVANNNSAQLGSKTEFCVTKINIKHSEKSAIKFIQSFGTIFLGK